MWNTAKDPFVLERVNLSAFLPDPFVVSLGPLKAEPHNASEFELLCLASLTKAWGVTNAFEIGTFDGRSTRAMAMNLRESGRVYTLNLPPGQDRNVEGIQSVDSQLNVKVASGCRFFNTAQAEKIEQLYGDSATFDFKPYADNMDVVFIDGSHARAYVEKDTHAALSMIKSTGGWVIWHDAPLYGVAPYLKLQMRKMDWDVRLIDGTTLALAYVQDGEVAKWPEVLAKSDEKNHAGL